MVIFSHDEVGTAENAWVTAGIGSLPRLEDSVIPGPDGHLIVVVAHPDDESLGAAGLIHTALRRGAIVSVLICSDGEASHPSSPTYQPVQLAALRRQELDTALHLLLDGAPVAGKLSWHYLGLPDGGLARHEATVQSAINTAIDGPVGGEGSTADIAWTVLAAPYRFDAHTDHDAVGVAAARVASQRHLGLLEFPIWYWHWASPNRQEWRGWHAVELDTAARTAKQRALGAHRSQTLPLSPAPGDEALLGEGFLEHFRRPTETFRWTSPGLHDSASAARIFDELYRKKADPWDYLGSAYERRKRAVTLASLPRAHYATAIEAGCSIGVLTASLAARCSHLLGIDASQVALDAAGHRVAGLKNVSLLRADLPGEWPKVPPGSVELVVLSEIGYFLGREELQTLLEQSAVSLQPGGHLLLCHWLHPIDGWDLDGQLVHDTCRSLGWRQLVVHREEDFLLEILSAPGGTDV
ncbi:PIG-L family deacetylase [Arthrobacter rhombi]|uniref:Methyltransferase type 12 n=1 Tax=Arthrobacter rhombi TaxID=71253 RepID=A0A1R4GRC9_9MICC|nr:PIG-L family deacetylase [Arthrobacter rhombi]SJM70758.1 Methyltransferase type 12 [Arthrobacter rhombi]